MPLLLRVANEGEAAAANQVILRSSAAGRCGRQLGLLLKRFQDRSQLVGERSHRDIRKWPAYAR